ncbi:hypothetical protein [Chengkuizengella sediminis]|uniref:hypothetical protein n=1 Tax=Chengkuizengella sediminis TaxID=1885917 RepID=UPI00138A122F|nr:hypothetical protein [Chengkuizengella sediminis]NDI33602.1 hypothetical protein [Chengkuizengella sediminis]
MGVFYESKCNCCVCPMQCVLEQLIGVDNVGIVTPTFFEDGVNINQVKDFIAFTNKGDFPICQISLVAIFDPNIPVNIKPIRKSKGECACCEDPITNLAKSLIGKFVEIEFINNEGDTFDDGIINVGEGIVVGRNIDNPNRTDFISSCAITRITSLTQQQINDPNRLSNSFYFKKITPPLST